MQLQIKVFSGVQSMIDNTFLFEKIVDVHPDLQVPSENVVSSLKFMYGSSCVVQLNFL